MITYSRHPGYFITNYNTHFCCLVPRPVALGRHYASHNAANAAARKTLDYKVRYSFFVYFIYLFIFGFLMGRRFCTPSCVENTLLLVISFWQVIDFINPCALELDPRIQFRKKLMSHL